MPANSRVSRFPIFLAWFLVAPVCSLGSATAQQAKIYYCQDTPGIGSVDGDGTHDATVHSGPANSFGFAVHHFACDVYFPGWDSGGAPAIRKVKTNGTGLTDVLDQSQVGFQLWPTGLDIDELSGRIYWIQPAVYERVASCKLDGTDVQVVLRADSDALQINPYSIQVDPFGGKLYFYDNRASALRRADLDGTDVELLYDLTRHAAAIELHYPTGELYWTEGHQLFKAPMDGSGTPAEVLDLTDPFQPFGLSVNDDLDAIHWCHDSKIRWTPLSNPGTIYEISPANGNSIGAIEVHNGPSVVLSVTQDPKPGDTMVINTCGGQPNTVGMKFIIAVNGTPFSRMIDLGISDSLGEDPLSAIVPPGLTGTTLDLIGITFDVFGRSTVSLPGWVKFQ